jgi:serine/threonine-protein kinase HipA
MIRVWIDERVVGTLGRFGERGSSFVYDPGIPESHAVSLSMPKRIASWNTQFGIAPIFEMNLPEGELRARLTRQFAKVTGTFDDYDLLTIVGRTQIGRLRYSDEGNQPVDELPFQSIDDILRARRSDELYDYLLATFARHSGISGVQPKVLIRAVEADAYTSVQNATHIVKLWTAEYPELATNEFFCLEVARRVGLTVPRFELSDNGAALVVDRFDRTAEGNYLGFEDLCVLNGFRAERKYSGSYETRVFKRATDFVSPSRRRETLETLFRLFVVNCAIRNGDAHLKNFGVLYTDATGTVELAPTYDLVTTTAYVPPDKMALTLNGSTDWPDRKALLRLGQTRADLTARQVNDILTLTADVVSDVARALRPRFRTTNNPTIGNRMIEAWEAGRRSLTAA